MVYNRMKYIAWIGTVASIIGAFLVAFHIIFVGYCAFIIGTTAWLYIGIIKKDSALYALNGTLFLANIIGLINAF